MNVDIQEEDELAYRPGIKDEEVTSIV